MADMRYFATADGKPVRLTAVWHHGTGRRAANFTGLSPAGVRVTCERIIEYKASPSRHQCDDRCMRATGRIMRCECACGGLNHGRGVV